jgi:hypothetical protein
MPDARYRMPDAGIRSVRRPVIDLPAEAINFSPQITQIDADDITKGPGLYLRYLRHLRAS